MNYLMGMKSFGLSYEDAQDKGDFLSLSHFGACQEDIVTIWDI